MLPHGSLRLVSAYGWRWSSAKQVKRAAPERSPGTMSPPRKHGRSWRPVGGPDATIVATARCSSAKPQRYGRMSNGVGGGRPPSTDPNRDRRA